MFALVGRQTNLDEKARYACRNEGDEVASRNFTLIILDIRTHKRTKREDSYFRFVRVATFSVGSKKSLETIAANRERKNQEEHRV